MTAGAIDANRAAREMPEPTPGDAHLRACRAVLGNHIQATDGEIGHVDDFLVDDRSWGIRYLVVNTSNWWVGHRMLVAPSWITAVDWSTSTVSVDLTRHAIETAPRYDEVAPFVQEQEEALFEHYGRTGHWPVTAKHDAAAPAVK